MLDNIFDFGPAGNVLLILFLSWYFSLKLKHKTIFLIVIALFFAGFFVLPYLYSKISTPQKRKRWVPVDECVSPQNLKFRIVETKKKNID